MEAEAHLHRTADALPGCLEDLPVDRRGGIVPRPSDNETCSYAIICDVVYAIYISIHKG